MYRNPGQERSAEVSSRIIKESRPFLHFTTAWRDYPGPVVGSFLFAAVWMGFAGGIESSRTAADLAGTAIFAFTGCLVCFRQFKPVGLGIALLAGITGGFLTAVGGGTLRTLLLGLGPDHLFWVDNGRYGIAIGLGLLLATLWEPRICVRWQAHWNAADRMALAVFAPLGAEQALLWEAEPPLTLILVAAFFGFLTGAGGGVCRDLLRLRLPTALLTTFGWIAALGATFHLFLFQARVPMAWIVSAAVIYLLAESTHQWDWRSRVIRDGERPPSGSSLTSVDVKAMAEPLCPLTKAAAAAPVSVPPPVLPPSPASPPPRPCRDPIQPRLSRCAYPPCGRGGVSASGESVRGCPGTPPSRR